MSAVPLSPPHPIAGCVAELGAALDAVTSVDPGFMRTSEKAAALVALTGVASWVAEVRFAGAYYV